MRISDWSSDVCSSDLRRHSNALHHAHDPCSFSPRSFEDDASTTGGGAAVRAAGGEAGSAAKRRRRNRFCWPAANKSARAARSIRSEEHTSELQSLMRISYAVFCLKQTKQHKINRTHNKPPK